MSVRCAAAMAAVVCGLAALPAVAADMSWFVQGGDGDRAVKEATVGVTRQLWPGPEASSSWTIFGEGAVGEWVTHDHPDGIRSHFTHVGLTPVVRYSFGDILFVEAGIGAQVILPRFHDAGRRFSTVFNFGDHVAIGKRFGTADENELSFRAEHFSNGGIRNPNPGQNFLEMRYARHF